MLIIKTYISASLINGIGLFTGENIPKETKIWKWDDGIDMTISAEKWRDLLPVCKEFIFPSSENPPALAGGMNDDNIISFLLTFAHFLI